MTSSKLCETARDCSKRLQTACSAVVLLLWYVWRWPRSASGFFCVHLQECQTTPGRANNAEQASAGAGAGGHFSSFSLALA
eukprot:15448565-Alexandrium_andersonii.AAC.1